VFGFKFQEANLAGSNVIHCLNLTELCLKRKGLARPQA
jgi:hypothetical protein